jgi:hypothetical protein
MRWFDTIGVQRHIKVLGIFCRLWHRDGKIGYLDDLPLVLNYVLDACQRYPELVEFGRWLEWRVSAELPLATAREKQAPERRKPRVKRAAKPRLTVRKKTPKKLKKKLKKKAGKKTAPRKRTRVKARAAKVVRKARQRLIRKVRKVRRKVTRRKSAKARRPARRRHK